MNTEITNSLIQQHKTAIWKEHLNKEWDHNQSTHTLVWETIHGLGNQIHIQT